MCAAVVLLGCAWPDRDGGWLFSLLALLWSWEVPHSSRSRLSSPKFCLFWEGVVLGALIQPGCASLGAEFCPPPPCPSGSASQRASGVWPGRHMSPFRCLLSPFLRQDRSTRASRAVLQVGTTSHPVPARGSSCRCPPLCSASSAPLTQDASEARQNYSGEEIIAGALVGKDIILRWQRDWPPAGRARRSAAWQDDR